MLISKIRLHSVIVPGGLPHHLFCYIVVCFSVHRVNCLVFLFLQQYSIYMCLPQVACTEKYQITYFWRESGMLFYFILLGAFNVPPKTWDLAVGRRRPLNHVCSPSGHSESAWCTDYILDIWLKVGDGIGERNKSRARGMRIGTWGTGGEILELSKVKCARKTGERQPWVIEGQHEHLMPWKLYAGTNINCFVFGIIK